MVFEWDQKKNEDNIRKHRVSFEEAETVFFSEDSILFDDPDHSTYEERFIMMGLSVKSRMLIVCHCYRKGEAVIRIISARKATAGEENEFDVIKKGW